MQLVYFWEKDCDNLKEQEINFNSTFKFKMNTKDGEYTLERIEKEEIKIPENFFGERIENISCVIGGNGSGKTTLFHSIITKTKVHNRNNSDSMLFLSIFVHNNDIYIFFNKENEVKLKILFNYKKNSKIPATINTKYIYFNNDIYRPNIGNLLDVFDISPWMTLNDITIKKEKQEKQEIVTVTGREILLKNENKTFYKLADFIFKESDIIENIPYEDLKKRVLKTRKSGVIEVYLLNNIYINENEKKFDELYSLIGVVPNKLKENLISKCWKYLCSKIVEDINKKKIDEPNFIKRKDKDGDIEKWFAKNIGILEDEIKKYKEKIICSIDNIKFHEGLSCDILDRNKFLKIVKLFNSSKYNGRKDKFLIKFDDNTLNKIKDAIWWDEIFSFKLIEGFSSGEILLLNLIKNILDLKTKINLNGNTENIIFFIEELESFMHPEWQRKIVNFMKVLTEIVPWMKNLKIQIIFASHTPFLVGDLPKGNVSYLKNKKIEKNEEQTFGGNIYDILKKSFLMESYFGEFSTNKIKEVLEQFSKKSVVLSNEKKKEIEFIISSVGELLVRQKLEGIYNSYKKNEEKKLTDEEKLEQQLKNIGMTKEMAKEILNKK